MKEKYKIETRPYSHGTNVALVETPTGETLPYPQFGLNAVWGTAPLADADILPYNTPVFMVGMPDEITAIGAEGTLAEHASLAFHNFTKQPVIYIRIEEGVDDAETIANLIGGVDVDGNPTGLNVAKIIEATTGYDPSIVACPRFSHHQEVRDAMLDAADVLEGDMWCDAFAVDAPRNFTDAVAMAELNDNIRFNVAYEDFIFQGEKYPTSSYFALIHGNYKVYESCSNELMPLVESTSPRVDWRDGDANCLANKLNEKGITCIIREKGNYKMHGVRGTSTDPRFLYRHFTLLHKSMMQVVRDINYDMRDKNLDDDKLRYIFNQLEYRYEQKVGATVNGQKVTQIPNFELVRDAVENTPEALSNGAWGIGVKYGRYGVNEQLYAVFMIDDTGSLTNTIQTIEGVE